MSLSWRRVAVLVITVTLTLASAISPPARAAVVADIDQEQPAIQPINGGDTLGGPSHQRVAQVVQVGIAGDLMFVELPIECFGDSTLTIEIQNIVTILGPLTLPSGTVLASSTVAAADLPAADASGFRLFDIAGLPTFNVKDQFAIVLTATGPGALDSCMIRHAPAGDTYTLGDGWFVNDGQVSPWNPGGWLCKCDGGTGAAFDYPFRTYMQQPAPPPPTDADLSITMTLFDLENPGATNTFSATGQMYQLMVTNEGPADASDVTIVDTLPPDVTVLLMSTGCTEASGAVTCTESLLPAGGGTFFNIAFRFDKAGSYTNTATVSATETDPDMSNNTASLTTQVYPTADLAWMAVGAAEGLVYGPGDTVTWHIVIKNNGPDPAGKVVLLQTLPAGMTFQTVTSPDTTICGQESSTEYGCQFSSIPVGATRSMTLSATAPTSPQKLTTTWVMSHIQPTGSFIYDFTWNSTAGLSVWVIAESTTSTVTAGGMATTDNDGELGASENDIIETDVTSPNPGTISITEQKPTVLTPPGTNWKLLGVEVVISAPAATTGDPLGLTFRIDSAFLFGGVTAADVDVYRNYSTTPIGDCASSGTPPQATLPITPDPCVASRTTLSDGDVEITVLTSQASVWRFSVPSDTEDDGKKDKKRFKKAKKS